MSEPTKPAETPAWRNRFDTALDAARRQGVRVFVYRTRFETIPNCWHLCDTSRRAEVEELLR